VNIVVGPSGSIAYGAGLFAAIYANQLYTSPDGINWIGSALGGGTDEDAITTILWDGSRFVAAGNSIITSTDGINWMIQTSLPGWVISDMAAGNNVIVGLTEKGEIITSP
jgi:hypothetical protein